MKRSILHVDMDAFYASIEERENPALKGRPIVVGALPGGRGVVSTASYAARAFGVHSAMPISRAARLLPHGVYLPVRMSLYAAVSRQVMEILARYTPLVEPLSLDEAFLDVTASERLFGDAVAIARKVREDVRRELSLPASVGVAPTKFVAKIASDMAKPDGMLEVRAEDVVSFLAPLPVRKIFGIGPESEAALKRRGFSTIADLQAKTESEVVRILGSFGATLHALAGGRDERAVDPVHEAKSHGRETTFARDVTDRRVLLDALLAFSADVAFELRRRRLVARRVELKLRYDDFTTLTRHRSLERPVQTARRIFREARALLDRVDPKRPVRLVGVSASALRHEEDGVQLSLFSGDADAKALRVERALDAIRGRYGKEGVRPASLVEGERTKRPSARDGDSR